MRSKRISYVAATAVAAAVLSAAGLPGASAAAGPGSGSGSGSGPGAGSVQAAVPLPLAHYSHMVVDPDHQHLFLSGGPGSDAILVTDYAGQTVATVPGETNATGLALSPDGGTLYAALGSTDAVSAISTATLAETARYATGAGSQPKSVAWSAGRIWFGYEGTAPFGGIGSIDPSSTPAAVTLQATGDTWYGAPILAAGPQGRLAAGEPGQSPAELAAYDVSGGQVSVLSRRLLSDNGVSSNLRDLAVTPDGQDLVTACGAPYEHQVWRLSDLTAAGAYGSAAYPDAVALGADGTVFAGSDDVYGDSVFVFAPGDPSALRTYAFASGVHLAPAGLAVTPDGSDLFAVTADVYGDNPSLNVLTGAAQSASGLTLTGPATVRRHASITLTGTLSGPAPYVAGRTLHVTRTDAAHPGGVALPDATTAADGSFTVTDTPAVTGTVTYTVSFDGDAHLTPSTADAAVRIGR